MREYYFEIIFFHNEVVNEESKRVQDVAVYGLATGFRLDNL
jgi:hypothetical protein